MKSLVVSATCRGPLPAQQQGFSLLEVLVAFAILSISLGVLLQTFSAGLRNAGASEDYTQATLYAESILTAIGRDTPLQVGNHAGPINDQFSWRSAISAYTEGLPDPEKIRARVYRVEVEVFWGDPAHTRAVKLETLRLVPLEPANGRGN